jgi:hypothetical protein
MPSETLLITRMKIVAAGPPASLGGPVDDGGLDFRSVRVGAGVDSAAGGLRWLIP